jgi:hypothetical protein
VSALLLAGCGGSSSTQTESAPVSTLPSFAGPAPTSTQSAGGAEVPGPSEASALPDLVVDDVNAGTEVNLASLVPSPEPILVWLWAPH